MTPFSIQFSGSAGQSFGAFVPRGITLDAGRRRERLLSAKGCPAASSSFFRRTASRFVPEDNIIIGNVVLYGATSGEAYVRGVARGAVLPCATAARTPSSKARAITAAST